MSMVCDICGKSTVVGRSQKHRRGVAGKRWRKRAQSTPRMFKPNLQRVTLRVAGETRKMKVCTKCLKRIRKYGAVRNYKNIAII
jgi:large subunit ribosomal protein L28